MIEGKVRRRTWLKTVLALAAAILTMLSVSVQALGAGRVEVERDGQMRLEYIYEGNALTGAAFRLYRVGDITETAKYRLSGAFTGSEVNLDGLDSDGWKAAASTLASYAVWKDLEYLDAGTVDEQGYIDFGFLSTGLYLLDSDDIIIEGTRYHSDPFLVSLPSLNKDDVWEYDMDARPKSTNAVYEITEITVIKVWNDGSGTRRPQEITAILLMDGEEYGRVNLSSSNQWRHTWTGLNRNHTYNVVEENIPADYTVTYTSEGAVFTVTNTAPVNPPGGGGSDGGGDGGRRYNSTPPSQEIAEGDIPLGNAELPEDPVPLAKLPQTGLLWWPVPFLVIAGLVLIGFGYKDYFSRKRNQDEEE